MGVFDKYVDKIYKYRYRCTLLVDEIHGGVPLDPKTATGWIRTKMDLPESEVKRLVVQTMHELAGEDVDLDALTDEEIEERMQEAIDLVAANKTKNTFKRDPETGELYIENRQLKSMLKENANIQFAGKKWGSTNKGTKNYMAEHIFIKEKKILLGRTEPDGEATRFISKYLPGRGPVSAIQTEDFVRDVKMSFTVVTDIGFKPEEWGALWASAQFNGVGAARSQGYGTFEVIEWEKLS